MYKRILIATDGSRLSRKAIAQGMALAKALHASVIGFHARPPYPTVYYGEPVMVPPSTERQFERETVALARKYLAEIEAAAKKARVPCKVVHSHAVSPAESLVKTARKEKCDLIVMASHGRRGFSRLLLGSETNKVLTGSHIPVLVTR